jgi:hypothetical protein
MLRMHMLSVGFMLVHVMSAGGAAVQRGELPFSVRGGAWTLEDSVRTFKGEELFALIDGGAPLYFEYGFVLVRSARYLSASGGEVAVEAYEMRSEAGAFGLYSYLSAGSGTPATIGQGAVEGTGFLLALHGRRVWSITALDGAGMDSVGVLAREFVGPSEAAGSPLPVVRWFARFFPDAREVVLFFGPLGFQKRAPFAPTRSMAIGTGMSGMIPEGEVLVLEYSSLRDAGMRYDSLLCSLGLAGDTASGPGAWNALSRGGRELVVARKGEYVVILTGADRGRLLALWRRLK